MPHYLNIHLRPDPELSLHQLMGGIYTRLHRALVQLGSQDIGVSFPGYDDRRPSLGAHLRLHGPDTALRTLMATPWLNGIQDHLEISPIAVVPEGTLHRNVRRVQAKSSPERLRRRAIRRHGPNVAAELRVPDAAAEFLQLPFVTLGSRSTGQPSFPLFIRHGEIVPASTGGSFNSYGLSHEATVPWF